jgi:SpoIID/LytB domain protein
VQSVQEKQDKLVGKRRPGEAIAQQEKTSGEAETKNPEPAPVPVVATEKTRPQKADVEPTVKVQLFGGASSIMLRSPSEMRMSFGANTLKVKPHSCIQFKPRSARISVRSYAVGVATYHADEYDAALRAAEKWKKDGYTVRLIKAGGPLIQADGTVTDTTVYWVALGIFKDKNGAERLRDKLFGWGISCWVIDESVLNPSGNIELVGEKDKTYAYADSLVTIESRSSIEIFDVPFGHGFWDSGHRENRSYSSPIKIMVDPKGKLAAINELELEEYVKGIIPVEIRLSAHDEAMKAQAVAARTESLAKIKIQHAFDPYDFCASQHCQEFGGLARRTQRTNAAVDATRGQVLMHNGSLVDAVYSANCGGHTEHNEDVWSSRPNMVLRGISDLYSNPESFDSPIQESQLDLWLKTVPRAYCADRRVDPNGNFRWKIRYRARELDTVVSKYRGVGNVRDMRVLGRGVSGRAKTLKIVGTRGAFIINKELKIRQILGGLKSSMFVIDISRDSSGDPTYFTFYGGGWGHGVGMCQAGAEGMALRGFKYPEILKHYFTGADIKDLYE